MSLLQLLEEAKNGDISVKNKLIDSYYPILVKKANITYQSILDAYKKYYKIQNDKFKLDSCLLDLSDVIDEFYVQFEVLLNEFLSTNLEGNFQMFMNERLYQFKNAYIKEMTYSVGDSSKGSLFRITECNPDYKKIIESYSIKKNQSVLQFPIYNEAIKNTINELSNFLMKYMNLTINQIQENVYDRARYILNKLDLTDEAFFNNFIEQLNLLKIEYLQEILGINWKNKNVKPTIDILMRKKLKSCTIMEIPYYNSLVKKCIDATQEILEAFISVDKDKITNEMTDLILVKVELILSHMTVFKISDFESKLNQVLLEVREQYPRSVILKASINYESDDSPKKLF